MRLGACLFPSLGSSVGPEAALQASFLDHRGPRGVDAVRSGSVNASERKRGKEELWREAGMGSRSGNWSVRQ